MVTTDGRAYQATTATGTNPLVDAAYCEWCRRHGHTTVRCRSGKLAPSYAKAGGPITPRLILYWADNVCEHRKNDPNRRQNSNGPDRDNRRHGQTARLPRSPLTPPRDQPPFPLKTFSLVRSPSCPGLGRLRRYLWCRRFRLL